MAEKATFILSAFADEIADDLHEQIAVLKKTKIRHIEMRNVNGKSLVDYSLEEAKEIKKILDQEGIALSAIGSPIGKIQITDDFAPHLVKFKHTLELAKVLDAKYIRMFSFFIPTDQEPQQYRDEVFARWNSFVEAARGTGITLLHENEKEIYGDSIARCAELLSGLDKTIVRGIFDPANFVQCGQVTYPEGFHTLKEDIVYLHIKDALANTGKVMPAGQGDGKVADILSELADDHFCGYLSIEPHLNTGDISVGGEKMFMVAYEALMVILEKLDVIVK